MALEVDGPVVARLVSRRDRIVDAGIAAAMLAGALLSLALSVGPGTRTPPWWAIGLWALALSVPLAWRRVAPIVAASIVIPAFLIGQAIGVPEYLVSQIAPFLALYSVGAWSAHRRRALVARAVLGLLIVVWFVVAALLAVGRLRATEAGVPLASVVALNAVTTLMFLIAAIAFGETAWRSALRRIALERRTAELQAERELTARQAVAVERLRIARELHDVVAHRVSVIGVQAAAARRVLPSSPERAADALAAVEDSARRAIDDLATTVIALRDPDAPDGGPDAAVSTLGLAQLPQIVAEARDAGTPVELEVSGDPSRVPATTALALYRVAQEALTNVRKHAGAGARASVVLRIDEGTAELVVADAGGRAAAVVPGTGLGQLGMRERIGAAGGTLELGPAADGYRVRAVVPVRT